MNKFKKKNKQILQVDNDKYLIPMLTPTSSGSNYWDPAPIQDNLSDRYFGRVLLQLHQTLGLFYSLNIETKEKKILDIGTGNGLIPQLLLNYSDISSAVGVDPYEENEHMSSWQPANSSENLKKIIRFIDKNITQYLSYDSYKKFLNLENYSYIPPNIKIKTNNQIKDYKKLKIGAHDLGDLKDQYDIIYCKAIEHIPNWKLVFENINKVSKKDTIVYFKHRSFFSYLGPHRFASIGIPWGHLLLDEDEYRQLVKKNYPSRSEEMIKFFFNGLAYPRYSVSDMCEIALKNGFYPIFISSEKPRYFDKILKFTMEIDNFWSNIRDNYPRVSSDEILSGMYHIVFKKI